MFDQPETITKNAMKKVAEWARAYVENETCIPETPIDQMDSENREGLMALYCLEQLK